MITMEMLGRIRRMHLRDKVSLHEISKRTGLSRNTLRKWLKVPEEVKAPRYMRAKSYGKLASFTAELELALKADAQRIKQDRRTGKALFLQIKANGYAGSYSRVTDFIRQWRGTEGKKPHAFVPLTFELGEAFQFDWSEEGMVVGGIYYRMQVSHMKLCASRAFWLVAYPSQGHEMLFDAHTRSFAALGGVARRGIYDNMKTAVDKVTKGKGRIVNARFAVMCAHYLFDADFCNVASGWEKGVVEKNVQDSRRRIWVEAKTRKFGSFDELNAWRVSTRLYPTRIKVVAGDAVVASHERLSDSGHTCFDWQHYIDLVQRKPGALRNGAPFADMPEPLKKLKQGLLRHPGGDKIMAQVLAAVPTAGLESVLVAVELVIESGVLSAEHVHNVVARLNAIPVAPTVESTLELVEAPRANTNRYDSLRGIDDMQEAHHAS